MTSQTLEFQAESRRLLALMADSVYPDREIFLRELIANASDALARVSDGDDRAIRLEIDADARTLSIADNGIGMRREEVISYIGTIARSGSDAQSIGQFGIGFYACFMVASRVELITRREGEPATRWTSDGQSTYTVEEVEADFARGTRVTLHLLPVDEARGILDYTSELRIREIVKRHADFIPWPVRLYSGMIGEWVTLNVMTAIWSRSPDAVTAEEYDEFYKARTHQWDGPLKTIHMQAEGRIRFDALLYVPSRALSDLLERRAGVSLYVKHVLVAEDCPDLLPPHLDFITGVVDAHDLPLDLSRGLLHEQREVDAIRRRLVRRVMQALTEMDRDDYHRLWELFGRRIKDGIRRLPDERDALLDLCLFPSTAGERLTSLAEYVGRMPPGQEVIHYLAGPPASPHLAPLLARGEEVLLLTDPVDEMWIREVATYRGRRVVSAARPTPAADGPAGERPLAWVQALLAEHVREVRAAPPLGGAPARVACEPREVTPALEKLLRASGRTLPRFERILEVDLAHPLVAALLEARERGVESGELARLAVVIHGLALLADNGDVADPARFSEAVSHLALRHASRLA